MEDAHADILELESLLAVAKRPHVRRILERELGMLRASDTRLTSAAALTAAGGPIAINSGPHKVAEVEQRRSYRTLTAYAWDETKSLLTLHVNLVKAEDVAKDMLRAGFANGSVTLEVDDLHGIAYRFRVSQLHDSLESEPSNIKIKPDKIVLQFRKTNPATWGTLKKTAKSKADLFKSAGANEDPSAALTGMMKKMYEEGDDEMKRMMTKAWTESREKGAKGAGAEPSFDAF